MKGLWCCHWLFSSILDVTLTGDMQHTQAYLVQACKALHQVALDRGSWNSAHLLLPEPDPLSPEEFGGDVHELLAAHAFTSVVSDLEKSRGGAGQQAREEDEENEEEKGPITKKK